jgi:MHS family proline/betaine transporter-like MFS transporter
MLKNKFFRTAVIGNLIEYYDIALYSVMFTKLLTVFFPHENYFVALLWGFGTFAVGGIMRPVGGIIFGHIGDLYGRRYVLIISVLLIFIPTFIIGIVPDYDTIGIAAPIIITICRLIASICAGGESIGVIVYVLEKTRRNQANYISSLICSVSFVGVIIGGVVCSFFNYDFMPEWAWRIPFIVSIFLAYCSYHCRKHLNETSKFQSKKCLTTIPFFEVLKKNPRNLVCTFGLGAACAIPFHIMTIYSNSILNNQIHLPISQVIFINTLNFVIMIFILIKFGKLADRIGNIPVMLFSLVMVIIISTSVFNLIHSGSIIQIIISKLIIAFAMSGFLAGVSAFMVDLFPVETRSTGMGFAYNLGNSVLGITAPFIITIMIIHDQNSMYPALYLIGGSILGIVSIFYARKQPLLIKARI